MAIYFEYFQSDSIKLIREQFFNHLSSKDITETDNSYSGLNIRDEFFNFFKTPYFNNLYLSLARDVIDFCSIDENLAAIQPTPTPRVFRPEDHGTSYHCDYWYGHGIETHTIWVPIKGVTSGSTFNYVQDPKENERLLENFTKKPEDTFNLKNLDCHLQPVLPKENQCAIFNSKTIHGSPLNSSTNERLSFDFRIALKNDKTSTKDLNSYYFFNGKQFILKSKIYQGRYLKYITGGQHLNTMNQHIIIEGVCKNLNINIVAQEAELERFGQPIFAMHCKAIKSAKSKFDGIIVASIGILEKRTIDLIKTLNINVFCALEGEWI